MKKYLKKKKKDSEEMVRRDKGLAALWRQIEAMRRRSEAAEEAKQRAYAEKLKRVNEFQLITKFMEILDKERKILEELMKIEEEYKILLKRKNAGELIADLIKQNRFQAEILVKKDKENIEEIYDILSNIGIDCQEIDEEYEILLERKNKGEYVDDLIKQNRNTKKILTEQNTKVWDELHSQGLKAKIDALDAEMQKELPQLKDWIIRAAKNLLLFIKNDMEYDNLLKRERAGESVGDLIKKNRIYAERVRLDNIKIYSESKEWLRMNPDIFQDPVGKSIFLRVFNLIKPLSYLREKRQFNTNFKNRIDKKLEVLEEIMKCNEDFKILLEQKNAVHSLIISKEFKKNEEEYEKLLERKNKGEFVDDLIKQNRYTAKVLTEQSKKVWD